MEKLISFQNPPNKVARQGMREVFNDETVPSLCAPTERSEQAKSNAVNGTDVNCVIGR